MTVRMWHWLWEDQDVPRWVYIILLIAGFLQTAGWIAGLLS